MYRYNVNVPLSSDNSSMEWVNLAWPAGSRLVGVALSSPPPRPLPIHCCQVVAGQLNMASSLWEQLATGAQASDKQARRAGWMGRRVSK